MKNNYIRFVIVYIVIVFLILIDMLTKIDFVNLHEAGELPIIIIPDILYLTLTKNTGAALGIFSNETLVLTIFTTAFSIALIIYDIFNKENSLWYNISFCLILSGAIGNVIDRIFLGYVRDFIGMFNWYICNLADVFICIGVAIYIIYLIVGIIKGKKENNIQNGKNNSSM